MPGSDTVPEIWAGRNTQLHEWENIIAPRLRRGIPERGRTILGEAGLGKSTLVRKIAESLEQNGDWATPQIRLPLGADPLKALANALLDIADRAGLAAAREQKIVNLLKTVRNVAVNGISVTFENQAGDEPYVALKEILITIGLEAIKKDKVVLVHLDEIQNVTDDQVISQLLVNLGDAITYDTKITLNDGSSFKRTLPLAVYLTGLPEFAEKASSRTGATFARRFATNVLDPLSDSEIRLALDEFITPGWEAAVPEATAHVERILSRLPKKEANIVYAMAQMGAEDRTATKIAQKLGYEKAQDIGSATSRLDTIRGIIYRGTQYGFKHRALEAYLLNEWPMVE